MLQHIYFELKNTDRYENEVSYYIYSPSETKKLVLEEFGYPEDEAKKLEESKKTASATPSADVDSDTTDGESVEETESTSDSAKGSSAPSAKALHRAFSH